ALLDLRFNHPLVGTVALETSGDAVAVLAVDAMLAKYKDHGLVNEVRLFMRRVLKRLDVTAKTFFAIVAPRSCFAGTLFELALAADRIYMKDEDGVAVQVSEMNAGAYPMGNGLTRLQSRFLKEPERVARSTRRRPRNWGSRPSRPTTSTGTTKSASPSRSAPRSRPTR